MSKTVNIILAFGIPTLLISGYWFGFRNRKPKLSIESVDWIAKKGVLKFGNNTSDFSLTQGATIHAGKGYSDLYTLRYAPTSQNEQVLIEIFKNALPIQEKVIDFKTKTQSALIG